MAVSEVHACCPPKYVCMPEVLWLLEHVRLRVDPLKDAVGSPKITPNSQLYVVDQHSNQAGHTHTWVANMHVPPILAFWCIV